MNEKLALDADRVALAKLIGSAGAWMAPANLKKVDRVIAAGFHRTSSLTDEQTDALIYSSIRATNGGTFGQVLHHALQRALRGPVELVECDGCEGCGVWTDFEKKREGCPKCSGTGRVPKEIG